MEGPFEGLYSPGRVARMTDIDSTVARVLAAFSKVAPNAEDLSEPLTDEVVSSLQRALGQPVPAELLALLRGRNGGWRIFEYDVLGAAQIQDRWERLTTQLDDGTFGEHEVFDDASGVYKRAKWSRGFVPFAQDGGGNLLLVDTDPGPNGQVGQALRWERSGGPSANGSRTLGEYLAHHADLLESGEYLFDEEGFYDDGPYRDDMYP